MKNIVKSIFNKLGLQINFSKNLWYLDAFYLLKGFIKKDAAVIFDVGGSDGSTIYEFKKILPNSIIYSFEPFPASYNNLKKITARLRDVYAYNLALSDLNGRKSFFVNASKATNSLLKAKPTNSFIDSHAVAEGEIEVEVKTIDTFVAENLISTIDILKLDVQGSELMVLRGAESCLRKKIIKYIYTEVWLIEGYEGQPLYHDLGTFLAIYGYKPFGIYNVHYRKDGHFLWADAIFYLDEN